MSKCTKNILGLFLLVSSMLYGHGSLSIRIKEKSIAISKDPNNSELYFERGYLYQQHLEYKNAIKDYLKSSRLGNKSKLLHYRKAEAYYGNENYKKALKSAQLFFKTDTIDVKMFKLHAQILLKLKQYDNALTSYDYVIKNTSDIRPEDIIEYSNLFLKKDSTNFEGAIKAISIGEQKLGTNILALQLKKISYFKRSNQPDKVLALYNQFIINNSRKEFWYYKKAKYLAVINRISESNIALQQARMSIQLLSLKFRNTPAVEKLIQQINNLEKNSNL